MVSCVHACSPFPAERLKPWRQRILKTYNPSFPNLDPYNDWAFPLFTLLLIICIHICIYTSYVTDTNFIYIFVSKCPSLHSVGPFNKSQLFLKPQNCSVVSFILFLFSPLERTLGRTAGSMLSAFQYFFHTIHCFVLLQGVWREPSISAFGYFHLAL